MSEEAGVKPAFIYMANQIEICNAALSQLGADSNITSIDPPDGTQYSEQCAAYYPMALRYLLEQFNWSFAQSRYKPPQYVELDRTLYAWRYGYSLPSDCMCVVGLYCTGGQPWQTTLPYEIEYRESENTMFLLTDVKDAVIVYTRYLNNPQMFPGYFTEALVMRLAAYLAGALVKNQSADKYLKYAEDALSKAKTRDAKKSAHQHPKYLAAQLRARFV